MTERFLRVNVPEGEALIAGVAVRTRADGGYTLQEYRSPETLQPREMATLLRELATTLELEADLDEP